jgi:hypothetical protein
MHFLSITTAGNDTAFGLSPYFGKMKFVGRHQLPIYVQSAVEQNEAEYIGRKKKFQ